MKKDKINLIIKNHKRLIVSLTAVIGVSIGIYVALNSELEDLLSKEVYARELFDSKINSINDYKSILDKIEKNYIVEEKRNVIEGLKQRIEDEASNGITNKAEELIIELETYVNNISLENENKLKELFTKINNINRDYFTENEIEKIDTYIYEYNESYNQQYYKHAEEVLNNLQSYLDDVKKVANTRRMQEAYEKNANESPSTREPKYINDILIVNKEFGLPDNYSPGENKEAKEAFNKMKGDAEKEGVYLNAFSIYRNYSTQNRLYNNYVASCGKESTDTFSARAGFSEHQTGLAFDVGGKDSSLWGEEGFNNTVEAKWLKENSHKYGFILRYPEEKEWKTGYMYESWHYRYLGTDHSKHFSNNNLTLEEYLGL